MATCHVLCAGPSVRPWIDQINWSNKSVFLVNGMPLVFNKRTKVTRWVMIDDIPEGLKEWAGGLSDVTRYCTNINKRDVLGGTVIRHNSVAATDTPEVLGFYWNGSVGNVACHLAWWLGYTRCMVWGLDYQNKIRCYSSIHSSLMPDVKNWENMDIVEVGWERTKNDCEAMGCRIFNCNPDSELRALPKIDPNEAALEE